MDRYAMPVSEGTSVLGVGRLLEEVPRRFYGYLCILLAWHVVGAFLIKTPFTYDDELQYWIMAHQAAAGQLKFTWTGEQPLNFPSILYPLILALFSWLSPPAMYAVTKILNSFLMTSTAFPTYLLARRIGARAEEAAWASLLAVAVPSMVFSADVLIEPVYYPLFTWVLYGIVRLLDPSRRPSALECLLWGLLMGGLFLVKPQGLLAPALFVMVLFWRLIVVGRRGGTLKEWAIRTALTTAGVIAGLGLRLVYLAVSGFGALPLSLEHFLGLYYNQNPSLWGGSLAGIGPVILAYGAMLAIAVGVLPFFSIFSRQTLHLVKTNAMVSLTWAVCLAASVALIVIFGRNTLLYNLEQLRQASSVPYLRAQERYLFPVSGVIYALWARSGASRPAGSWLTAIAVAAATGFGFFLLRPYVTISVLSDAPSLTGLMAATSTRWSSVLVWGAIIAACGLAAAAERCRPAIRRRLILGLLLALSAGAYFGDWWVLRGYGTYLQSARLVSSVVPADVTLLLDSALPRDLYFTIEFWHPSHWRLASGATILQEHVPDGSSGYLVVPSSRLISGPVVGQDSLVAVLASPASRTTRAVVLIEGNYPDGWLSPHVTVFGYTPDDATNERLDLSLDATGLPTSVGPQQLVLRTSGRLLRTVILHPGTKKVVTVPLAGEGGKTFNVTIQARGFILDTYLHNGDTRRLVVRPESVSLQ